MTVFFVDDDIDDRVFFLDALSYVDPNIKCILCKDCDQALEMADTATSVNPSYVFLDIHMPETNGLICLGKLKAHPRLAQSKIVMYSTASDEAVMAEYKAQGATYFLIKPPTFKDLCDSLALMFDKS